MIRVKTKFYAGLGLLFGFVAVVILFFSPIWSGHNGLAYLDRLYNCISKGSAFYFPDLKEKAGKFRGHEISASVGPFSEPGRIAFLFNTAGATASVTGDRVAVKGDLAGLLDGCLADAEAMYANEGKVIRDKYGYDERAVLYNWWQTLKAMEKQFQKGKDFKAADIVALVNKKAVETCYNYYGISPQGIGDRTFAVVFSLLFYVIYTVWYGFAFMFLFEGFGLHIGH